MMCKNLFLKDKKKGGIWLVVAKWSAVIDMKALTKEFGVGSGCLRFGPDDVLEAMLGVKKGSVTPLGLYKSSSAPVTVVLDSEMLSTDDTKLLFHPMRNDHTMVWSAGDFKKFLQISGHSFQLKDFPHDESQ
eukprot:TRINITY_DN1120_c1_g1_i2.p1 TRINITY_DN1120_c1_g1~~TRINITY_DN1120_c1_g1_i2.p1  ORF type:complete len:132 (+),score=30.69 TRINITY_DN1120_c1_g1_i2:272-667(+)